MPKGPSHGRPPEDSLGFALFVLTVFCVAAALTLLSALDGRLDRSIANRRPH